MPTYPHTEEYYTVYTSHRWLESLRPPWWPSSWIAMGMAPVHHTDGPSNASPGSFRSTRTRRFATKAPISTAWRKSERPARKSFTKGDRAQSLKTKQKEADPSRKCSPLDRLPHNIDSPRDRFNWSTSYRNPGRPAQPFDRSQLGLFHFFTQRPR